MPADAIDSTPTEASRETKSGWNILAVVSAFLALTASPLAVLFGYLAVGQIRRAGQRGEGLAWVAVALGWLWLVAFIVVVSALVIIWRENPFWP